MNTKGQTTLEGLIVLPVGIVVLGLLFWATSVGWGFMWIQYQLNESTVCLQDLDAFQCKKRFLEKVKGLTPYVQVTHIQTSRTTTSNEMRCQVLISFLGNQIIEMEKKIPR